KSCVHTSRERHLFRNWIKKASSLQNHYNYVFDNITNTYNFVTKNNILYRVAFVVDESFSSLSNESVSDMFQLVVEKASEGLEPYDAKVSKTIEDIIERFFRRKENSLIYICSDDDNRSKLRHDVFDRWYKIGRASCREGV